MVQWLTRTASQSIVRLTTASAFCAGACERTNGGLVPLTIRNIPLSASIVLLGAVLFTASASVSAQPYAVPPTWGGDIWSRPRLTGDWGGLRDELGAKGVVFDVDLLVTPMDVLSGGRSTGGDTWGNADYTLNVDTEKAGLWPGGFLKVIVDTSFGTALDNSGAIVPVNTATLIPAPNDRTTTLLNFTFMQFLSEKFGLVLGKFDTFALGGEEFYGDYNTQFLNAAFNFPMTLEQVPVSAFGGGIIVLPTEGTTLSLLALGSDGTATNNNVGDAFSNGTMVVGTGQVTIKPLGLVGHQNFGFTWNNQERFSLEQDPSNLALILLQSRFPRLEDPGPTLEQILARFFPGLLVPTVPANRESSSWSVNYAFDQYIWQPPGDSKHGIGVFFSAGASDGNPNPIKYAFLAGLGGKGAGPSRPNDTYGFGFARTQFSSAFVPLLRERLDLGLEHEDSFEAYYNLALTGWLSVTADLQIVDPGLKKTLTSTGLGLMNVDTATIAGVRFRVRF
jgi:porin